MERTMDSDRRKVHPKSMVHRIGLCRLLSLAGILAAINFAAAGAYGAPASAPLTRLGTPASRPVTSALWMSESPDGSLLQVRKYDGGIVILNADRLRVLRKMESGESEGWSQFLTDRTIVTGGKGGRVRIWDVATGKVVKVLRGSGPDIESIGASSDGKRIAYIRFGEPVTVIDSAGKFLSDRGRVPMICSIKR
jgi:WD40 repeat protein